MTTIPTIGFNVESVTYKNLNFNVWVGASTPKVLATRAKFSSLIGSGRPNLDTTLLALLLRKYRGRGLCRRLD